MFFSRDCSESEIIEWVYTSLGGLEYILFRSTHLVACKDAEDNPKPTNFTVGMCIHCFKPQWQSSNLIPNFPDSWSPGNFNECFECADRLKEMGEDVQEMFVTQRESLLELLYLGRFKPTVWDRIA